MSVQIPRPRIDDESRPYWEGLQKGELRIQCCESCRKNIFYPRSLCPYCFSEELSWTTAGGKGSIYSYTVIRHAFGAFKEEVPFVIGIIELEEGVRMMSRLIGDPEQIKIDKPVEVTFEKIDQDLTLPYFKLI